MDDRSAFQRTPRGRSIHERPLAAAAAEVGYDASALSRFLALSIALLVLVMALFQFGLEALGWLPVGAPPPPPPRVQLGAWGLEALGLAALFLLIQREGGVSWFTGLMTGWIAWVFRGPLLVVSVAAAGLDPKPYWGMSFRWWVLYSTCGLVLGILARPVEPRPEPPAPPPRLAALEPPTVSTRAPEPPSSLEEAAPPPADEPPGTAGVGPAA